MKAATILMSLLITAAATAQAEPMPRVQVSATLQSVANYEGTQPFDFTQSTRSRAEVQAEAAAARDAGQMYEGDAYPGPLPASTGAVTRAAVQAELVEARNAGTLVYGDAYPGALVR